MIIGSPFDNLIHKQLQRLYSPPVKDDPITPLGYQILSFTSLLRALYIRMLQSSIEHQNYNDSVFIKYTSGQKVFVEDLIAGPSYATNIMLSYFQFIEELNRYGKVLFRNELIIPDYFRIKFYRNIIVEHWNEYFSVACESILLTGTKGKILIPYHTAAMGKPQTAESFILKLKSEFEQIGITFVDIKNKYYGNYSDTIFLLLEKKFLKLYAQKKDKKLGKNMIPLSLIMALVGYGFPTPIHNIEEYSHLLVQMIETIPQGRIYKS